MEDIVKMKLLALKIVSDKEGIIVEESFTMHAVLLNKNVILILSEYSSVKSCSQISDAFVIVDD